MTNPSALTSGAPADPATERAPGLPPAPAAGLGRPDDWVDAYGDYLFRFALTRLRDESLAEDLVQETFLVALRSKDKFAGQSAAKSWLAGILKNKIADHFRRASRETSFTDLEFLRDEQSQRFIPDGPFKDGWIHELGPVEWSPNPGGALDNAAFWQTFHDCSGKLPRNVARVFMLREVDDIPSAEICALLNISPNNLWVMLHRARMALRQCLELNWFGADKTRE